jgi:hypothetical protein
MHFQGYISSVELLNIPELSINPLTRRLEHMFDSVNFKVRAIFAHSTTQKLDTTGFLIPIDSIWRALEVSRH